MEPVSLGDYVSGRHARNSAHHVEGLAVAVLPRVTLIQGSRYWPLPCTNATVRSLVGRRLKVLTTQPAVLVMALPIGGLSGPIVGYARPISRYTTLVTVGSKDYACDPKNIEPIQFCQPLPRFSNWINAWLANEKLELTKYGFPAHYLVLYRTEAYGVALRLEDTQIVSLTLAELAELDAKSAPPATDLPT
jgi:hypothetical protein